MQEINLAEFRSILEKHPKDTVFVDVRTTAEYKAEHIKGVQNIPLDEIKSRLEELKSYKKIYLHCQSGTRCRKAFENIQASLQNQSILIFTGGIEAWKEAGLPLTQNRKIIPIMRQVMITAGSLILIGFILFVLECSAGVYLMAFVGAGLLFAGITGWCGMARLLGLMPWNN